MSQLDIKGVPAAGAVRPGSPSDQSTAGGKFLDGREYVAVVVGVAHDKLVTIRIQDTLFNMKLGHNLAPGENLTLKYVSAGSVPTFILVQADLPDIVSEPVTISRTGTVIDRYLKAIQGIHEVGPALFSVTPMLSMPLDAGLIARELQQSVIQSGLFYESHQANYMQGKETLEHLMMEPQNQTDFEPSEMVKRQLDAIEKHSITWSGMVWSGQHMKWTTHVTTSDSKSDDSEIESQDCATAPGSEITSRLQLELPNLKMVVANFTLRAGALSLSIEVDNSPALVVLRHELSSLISALANSGQKVESCLVNAHEPT